MTPSEIRVRASYLFLACARAVDELTARLAATVSPPPPAPTGLEHALKRELGLLFRYWATQQVWGRLESNDVEAKTLNVTLLRFFTEAFKLPRDGSGLRYAELSNLGEELEELGRRITTALGMTHGPLLSELQGAILPWHDAVAQYAMEALELPVAHLASSVETLARYRPAFHKRIP